MEFPFFIPSYSIRVGGKVFLLYIREAQKGRLRDHFPSIVFLYFFIEI